MAAMSFPDQFIQWILMLHQGATTCFLLNFLTNPIKIFFSIRQGDPLSMLLYIIYIEPLLLMIRRKTLGLPMSSFVQNDEDYCDDLNLISESEEDLLVIEDTFVNFENVSGALLSRSRKSKIMGLGRWRNRGMWPLPWLQVVPQLKIFGFQVTPSFKLTLEKSWEKCFEGFHKILMSWSSRQLETLVQRVKVLRVFATSKLWYTASALPLPVKFSKKFESAMSKFIWMGKFEKLKIDEIKNPCLSGGLNLPCIISKSDSLFLSQTCRMLKYSGSREYKHIKYWLGLYLKEYFPDMGVGSHAEIPSAYFLHMKALLVGGFVLGDLKVDSLHQATAKVLYEEFTSSFPPPKVVYKFDVEWQTVWQRLQNPVLDAMGREVLFLVTHNIVPNKDRMFRCNMSPTSNCQSCGVVQDNVHLFCECVSVRESWFFIRQRLLGMLAPEDCINTNFEFIHMMFSSSPLDNEAVWLLGAYMHLVWKEFICKKKNLRFESFIAQIRQEFKSHQLSSRPQLAHITGLFQ